MISRVAHIALLVVVAEVACAQTIYNSTSIIVPAGASIYASDVSNSGLIRNSGTIETTGNWYNEASYQGSGTIVLSGTTGQSFDNNNQSVENLSLNGAGDKNIVGTLTIGKSIQFTSGILKVDDRDTLYIKENATIEGGSVASFVDGAMLVGGTGRRFFPVGRNGSYYPVTLTDIEGTRPVIQIAAFENMPDVNTSADVTIDRRVYWTSETIEGNFKGSPVSAPVHFEIEETERVVFVVADDLGTEFNIVENDEIETSGGKTFAVSKEKIKKSVFAIGELPEKALMESYLSTTLSPNASNEDNRVIKMFGPDLTGENFHFQVINRWGNTMFETRSLEDMAASGWDGKHHGQLVPAGAYPYRLTYVDRRGKQSTTSGFITIIY